MQTGAIVLLSRLSPVPFGLTFATVFAAEGIACMVVAWFLAGREGDAGFAARAEIGRAQIAGAPDLATTIPEQQSDFDAAARNAPLILILVVYGAILMVLAFLAAL